MSTIINVALPVFGIILAGYLAGRAGLLGQASSEALNQFVYWIALPPLLLISLGSMPFDAVLQWHFIGAFAGSALIVWLLAGLIGWLVHKASPDTMVMQGLCASFPNTGYMGLPLFVAAFGEPGLLPAIIGTVVNAALSIGLAVILLEWTAGGGSGLFSGLGRVIAALIRNPLVMASAAGVGLSWSGLMVPVPLERLFEIVGASASPTALFAIGLFMAGQNLGEDVWEVGWVSVLKLVWQPLICWALAVTIFPMEPFWQASAIMLSALPTGALVFVMAQRYGVYIHRSSATVLVSTVLSVATLTVLLAIYGPLFAPPG